MVKRVAFDIIEKESGECENAYAQACAIIGNEGNECDEQIEIQAKCNCQVHWLRS